MTIEHYYFGKLVMPFINGVSDGCIIVSILSAYTVSVGANHWATPMFDGRWLGFAGVDDITRGQAAALAISIGVGFINIYSILKTIYSRWYPCAT